MSAAVTYQIAITYCDGQVVLHEYVDDHRVRDATKEYADALAEAFQPSIALPNARHIRMVTMLGFDAAHLPVHHIHSGLIECTHRKG